MSYAQSGRSLHIIQNDPEVPPGTILEFLKTPYSLHHPFRGEKLPQPEQISSLIIMGGAMGAHDDLRYPFLTDLKILIRQVVEAGIPYLGICLGGQLLAAACGAQVVSQRWEELGFLSVDLSAAGKRDGLFSGVSETFTSFLWHHDSFDIPADGVLLASSEVCPHQAFRVGTSAWGVQFHPEVTEAIIRNWCAWDRSTRGRVEELAAAFSRAEEEYRATTRQIIDNFMLSVGLKP
ncbi:MAG TPA: type 1 glutamine amidotransferase [Desulfuromonadales bacterium]|nr:type 1 glutamine amidotransferase [Desulfuromonadales bacterium]